MDSAKTEILGDLLADIDNKAFDLEAWKKKAILILKKIFGERDDKISMIENLHYEFSSWSLRDSSGGTSYDKVKENARKIIEAATSELLLAKQLGDIDLVMAHHPVGMGLTGLTDVMEMQADVYNYYGVPINIAEALTCIRMSEVGRSVSSANHQKVVDAARILGVNFINVHTPADGLVAKFLKDLIEKENPERIEDLISLLKEIPEYKAAIKMGSGPKAITGKLENRCGKIAISEIVGGTGTSSKLMEEISRVGIGTVVGMHASEEYRKEAEAAHLNVVIAGHISSDSLGMNLFLDELEKRGIEIVCSSGLTRFKRF